MPVFLLNHANPESLKAGIEAVTSLTGETILCIGAMAEIGETSDQAHPEIAEFAASKGAKNLFVYGEAAKQMPQYFGGNAKYFTSHMAMAEEVNKILQLAKEQQQQVNVLVKGSRSAAMEKVAQPILTLMKVK